MNARLGLVVVLLSSCFALAGCTTCGPRSTGRAKIVVSLLPMADLVRRVAGPDADVTVLVPSGKSEHGYQPSPEDIASMRESKLAVMIGLGLDTWVETTMKDVAPKARVLKVGDRVRTIASSVARGDGETATPGPGEAAIDPHVWLDPERARLMTKAIAEEMARVDAVHANAFRLRANELDRELEALDTELEGRMTKLKDRAFVTAHPALAYFADRYGLRVVAVVERTPGTPPDAAHRALVLERMKKEKVAIVFAEPQLEGRPVREIAAAANVAVGVLDPLGNVPGAIHYEQVLRGVATSLEASPR